MRKLIALLSIIAAVAAPVTAAQAATKAQVKTAIRQVFGPRRAAQATCIASAESHLYNRAISRSGDHGEFQINAATWFGKTIHYGRTRIYVSAKRIYDPVFNATVAWVISHGGSNWGPWSTYTRYGLCH